MKASDKPTWIEEFPHFEGLAPAPLERLLRESRSVRLPAHAAVFQPGQPCSHYLLVRQGTVRVSLADTDGNEVVLYRLTGGESCVLTTAALLAAANYEAVATTEASTVAIMIPRATFLSLLAESSAFRSAVFTDHGRRLLGLMEAIGKLAFESIDYRLAKKLVELADATGEVRCTHQAIAFEVGTAREVVSRRLKLLEEKGWVKLYRGRVQLLKTLSAMGRPKEDASERGCVTEVRDGSRLDTVTRMPQQNVRGSAPGRGRSV